MLATRLLTAFLILGHANAQPQIRLNQLGFSPHTPKSAIIFSHDPLPEEFRILGAGGAVVFKGQLNPITGVWGEFNHHAELDFSSLTSEGSYLIEVGSTRSSKFTVSRTINNQLPDQLLEFMRQQRCGYNPYVDAACHTFDGRTPSGTYINASGGWHDAGDQL